MKALEELIKLSRTPYNRAVKDWKEKGGKVVGFVCSYVPEEILYAAGILPHRMDPTGCTETTEADARMSRLNCTFALSCLQFTLTGVYDFLDGVVCMNSCDHMRRLYDIWQSEESWPYIHFVSVPHRISEAGVQWYKDELNIFKESIEGAFGVKITDENLASAIEVHNTTRGLLNKLYAFREREKPLLAGSEMMSILIAAPRTPKEEYNELLERLLPELEERGGIPEYRARLMLTGGTCDDPGFVEMIEDLGGLVVTDTLCFGSRYFSGVVKTDTDPIFALAESYLHRPSCVRMAGEEPARLQLIMEMAQRFKVDGIIFQRLRWCDLWGHEVFYLSEKLKEAGIPFLPLEREYWISGLEQLKTRIQAFLEVVGR